MLTTAFTLFASLWLFSRCLELFRYAAPFPLINANHKVLREYQQCLLKMKEDDKDQRIKEVHSRMANFF